MRGIFAPSAYSVSFSIKSYSLMIMSIIAVTSISFSAVLDFFRFFIVSAPSIFEMSRFVHLFNDIIAHFVLIVNTFYVKLCTNCDISFCAISQLTITHFAFIIQLNNLKGVFTMLSTILDVISIILNIFIIVLIISQWKRGNNDD